MHLKKSTPNLIPSHKIISAEGSQTTELVFFCFYSANKDVKDQSNQCTSLNSNIFFPSYMYSQIFYSREATEIKRLYNPLVWRTGHLFRDNHVPHSWLRAQTDWGQASSPWGRTETGFLVCKQYMSERLPHRHTQDGVSPRVDTYRAVSDRVSMCVHTHSEGKRWEVIPTQEPRPPPHTTIHTNNIHVSERAKIKSTHIQLQG